MDFLLEKKVIFLNLEEKKVVKHFVNNNTSVLFFYKKV